MEKQRLSLLMNTTTLNECSLQ